jgi:hypothetical protein
MLGVERATQDGLAELRERSVAFDSFGAAARDEGR